MNTRVDFYLISADTDEARQRFACRIAEKAYAQTNSVYVKTASAAQAEALDELLWTFRDGSFVPHEVFRSNQTPSPLSRVLIGYGDEAPPDCDVLLNLDERVPVCAAQFDRIVEIVSADAADKQRGREHYRYYREQGFELHSHHVD